ncbi:MAG: GNAT family N-acetyltransferase [Actinobacteria bacterium]|nr:GNAT family N-acetyltransferase [Actinomycetota bacterium]
MEVVPYTDPARFRDDLEERFLVSEVRHNLILGVLSTLVDHPEVYPEFELWALCEGGVPVTGALRTSPYHLVVADLPGPGAARALASFLRDTPLPGVVGSLPAGAWFADAYAAAAGVTATVTMRQGVFALSEARPVPEVEGRPRPAVLDDLPLVTRWIVDFTAEALPGHDDDAERIDRMARRRLSGDDPLAALWLWEAGGRPVSMSGHGGLTPNGIRIGPVYTPPGLRGEGYATALVAAQSRWLLARGRRYCFLFTDLSNPTSNAIYRRIGYEQEAESVEVSFGGEVSR